MNNLVKTVRLENYEGYGDYSVVVYGNDNCQIPHFHIIYKDLNCVLQIYENDFFHHYGNTLGIINEPQAKELDNWLREKNEDGISNWDIIRTWWEENNRFCSFPEEKKVKEQPDYSNLNVAPCIGYIDFDDIGKCTVELYGPNEIQIPHFHIFNKDHSFESCIRIFEPEYLDHNGKYTDTLTYDQCKKLNEWMNSISIIFPYDIINWRELDVAWSGANDYDFTEKEKSIKQPPDYTKLLKGGDK